MAFDHADTYLALNRVKPSIHVRHRAEPAG